MNDSDSAAEAGIARPTFEPKFDAGRRAILTAIPAVVVLGCGCLSRSSCAQAQHSRRYCGDSDSQVNLSNAVLLREFTRPGVVAYVQREDELLNDYFGVSSIILIGIGSGDAFMDGVSRKIVVGDRYIDRYAGVSAPYGLLKISGVLAHEKSHIFQISWQIDEMLRDVRGYLVKYVELHADYMAGAYISWRERRGRDSAPQKLASFFYDLGDRVGDRSRHHGTEEERRNAFEAGYLEAEQRDNAEKAAGKGLVYVRRSLA